VRFKYRIFATQGFDSRLLVSSLEIRVSENRTLGLRRCKYRGFEKKKPDEFQFSFSNNQVDVKAKVVSCIESYFFQKEQKGEGEATQWYF
jgi:hypothetical protein